MTTFRIDEMMNTTNNTPMPDWFKSERYEYCEPFVAGKDAKKNGKKKSFQVSQLLSLFL